VNINAFLMNIPGLTPKKFLLDRLQITTSLAFTPDRPEKIKYYEPSGEGLCGVFWYLGKKINTYQFL